MCRCKIVGWTDGSIDKSGSVLFSFWHNAVCWTDILLPHSGINQPGNSGSRALLFRARLALHFSLLGGRQLWTGSDRTNLHPYCLHLLSLIKHVILYELCCSWLIKAGVETFCAKYRLQTFNPCLICVCKWKRRCFITGLGGKMLCFFVCRKSCPHFFHNSMIAKKVLTTNSLTKH